LTFYLERSIKKKPSTNNLLTLPDSQTGDRLTPRASHGELILVSKFVMMMMTDLFVTKTKKISACSGTPHPQRARTNNQTLVVEKSLFPHIEKHTHAYILHSFSSVLLKKEIPNRVPNNPGPSTLNNVKRQRPRVVLKMRMRMNKPRSRKTPQE